MRRSLHASHDLVKGNELTLQDIKLTRPYDGIDPWSYEKIIGKKIRQNRKKDEPITWGDML
jgi:N-acetylneuraminate synthase/N,N'-diacetyllegionaminate synthase